MSDIEAAIWSRIPDILKGTINLNTCKPKIKCYYLNDFCKSKYMNDLFSWLCFGAFKSFLFLLLFDCFWFYFWSFAFLFLASLWLKDYNKSKFMRLLCVIPPILFFFLLTHFRPMFSFNIPWTHQKISAFQVKKSNECLKWANQYFY